MGLKIIKVYVVSTGMYSDYSIRGIYSTSEQAKIAEKMFGSEADIEEWSLDVFPDYPRDKFYYDIQMAKNGKVICIEQVEPAITSREYSRIGLNVDNKQTGRIFKVWAKDRMHAIKIANERRTQLIVNNQWDLEEYLEQGGEKT